MTLTKRPMTPESRSPDDRIEAIARGVAARLEEKTGYYRKITEETVDIARALGLAEREIEKWAKRRTALSALEAARLKDIKAQLDRLGVESHA
jgi:hypothetical protein